MIELDHKVEIYVPANTLIQVVFVKKIAKLFATRFGGATITEAKGTWVDDKGELIEDKINIVYSYSDTMDMGLESALRGLAAELSRHLNEDCILLVIDGHAALIEPSKASGGEHNGSIGLQNA